MGVDKLSHLDSFIRQFVYDGVIQETFPDEHLLAITSLLGAPWYADIVNYLECKVFPPEFKFKEKKRLMAEAKHYFWDDPYLCNVCGYDVVRCYVPHEEVSSILQHCHCMKAGGHHGPTRTAHKVLQYGFFWPTLYRDANEHVRSCDSCQRIGALSRRFKMPQNNMLLVELFDV